MFNVGEYVVYGLGEICCIKEKTERCFDGVNKNEYYKLVPDEYTSSTYYVPVNSEKNELRRLLSKEKILEIIDNIPQTEGVWYNDKNERKDYFESVLKSNDFIKIVGMIKAIYEEREKRNNEGKKLIAADEKAFNMAEHILYGEFAFVLGINESDVCMFIRNRIAKLRGYNQEC